MTTLLGFNTIPPGTRFPVATATRNATWEEEVMSKRISRTFEDVPAGYLFDNETRLGVMLPFFKLRRVQEISSSRVGDFRKVNAIHCRAGEPIFFNSNTPVCNVRPPKKTSGRRLRREFFVDAGIKLTVVNAVLEDADVADNPDSHSGELEHFVDSKPK